MADPSTDTSGAVEKALPFATPQGFAFTDAQFQALLAAVKGQSPAAVVVADAKAVGSDIVSRMEALIADVKAEAQGVHGAAKALQADVKANWPLLLVGAFAIAGFVLHFVKVFGFGG